MHPWKPISARCPLATDHPLQGLIVGGRKKRRERSRTHAQVLPPAPTFSQPMASLSPCQSARAAITKHHRLIGLGNRNAFLTIQGAGGLLSPGISPWLASALARSSGGLVCVHSLKEDASGIGLSSHFIVCLPNQAGAVLSDEAQTRAGDTRTAERSFYFTLEVLNSSKPSCMLGKERVFNMMPPQTPLPTGDLGSAWPRL